MTKFILSLVTVSVCAPSAYAADIYVSQSTGDNANAGTMEAPLKNIEVAIGKAAKGDAIRVAEGNYFGLRGKGLLESPVALQLYGGYSPDFKVRDVLKHRTLIQPDNESAAKSRKAMLTFTKTEPGDSIVIDGFLFDMGMRNSYDDTDGRPEGVGTGMLLLPPSFNKARNEKPTVTEPILSFPATASAGDVLVRNCTFLNGASYAIQGGHKQGTFRILNNVFVANRMAAIEVFGTGGKQGPKGPTEKDGDVEIANNTILFTWSRQKDFKDMGYGIRVMTKLGYNIHHNIIGMSVLTGVDHTRFNQNAWLKLESNQFLLNKQADLMFSEPGVNTLERVALADFKDMGFAGSAGNTDQMKVRLPIHEAYLTGFLDARYSEEVDYDPNSPANVLREVMGLNKQGKLKTSVSMFANRYPLDDALLLFGAAKEFGAQKPE